MNTLEFDIKNKCGKIKVMHAVNNGPQKPGKTQTKGNFNYYKEAKIPYARMHDSAHWPEAGGYHVVDINGIFPDFSKDPYDAESYDFLLTDRYIENTFNAGTEVFYRLGASIEHWEKKYNILPPEDPKKWAVICEHIISHYTEGWADGYNYKIEYWEIWNEPDCKDNSMWVGTQQQFFDLYEISATHLKNKFPHLKIGGPAISQSAFGDLEWAEDFIEYMGKRNVPLDFFSWHIYTGSTDETLRIGQNIRDMLDKNGYLKTESILNEWNYLRDWTDNFVYSIEQIIGIKGAAFEAAMMCAAQNSSIDMLMYYDARPTGFNGLFDYYTSRPLKGYYPIKMFSKLYELGNQIECKNDMTDVYALGAVNDSNNAAFMIARYEDDDEIIQEKEITVSIPELRNKSLNCFWVDEDKNEAVENVLIDENGIFKLSLKPNCCILLSL